MKWLKTMLWLDRVGLSHRYVLEARCVEIDFILPLRVTKLSEKNEQKDQQSVTWECEAERDGPQEADSL